MHISSKVKTRSLIVAGSLLVVCLLFVGWWHYMRPAAMQDAGVAILQSSVKDLPKRSPKQPSLYLADGLQPPTNKWFSALALADVDQPVFSYPLSFKPTAIGFSVGTPVVVSSPNAIFGSHNPAITVALGTDTRQVSAYDDLSVALTQSAANTAVATTRITQGSPYTFTKFDTSAAVKVSVSGELIKVSSQLYHVKSGTQTYGIYVDSGTLAPSGSNLSFKSKKGQYLTIFTIAKGASNADYREAAKHPITGTKVTYSSSDTSTRSRYTITTAGGPTLFADIPSMGIQPEAQIPGTFDTVLGTQHVYRGNAFTSTIKTQPVPGNGLSLGSLSQVQRDELIASLKNDSQDLQLKLGDSYFGAKEVYRAANLLQLSKQLGQTNIASRIQSQLKARLEVWFEADGVVDRNDRYFYYDTAFKGLVGEQASYGSELFNDHHFHYGYFIYAAAILGQYDHSFVDKYRPMVETLIADIASPAATDDFPKLRVFDTYMGHSWASGSGAFNDGNNQESTSEAINAWHAINLWSKVTKNKALQQQSIWLYQNEVKSAQTYWLNVPHVQAQGSAYQHAFTGIVWGGKIDFSTFFSARPQSILGIQLIPMSPGQAYLSHDPASIRRNLAETSSTAADLNGQFNDYLLMYQSLADPAAALANLKDLSPHDLDNGNSMTYLKAYIYSRQ